MTSFELPVEPPPHTLALSDLDRGQARPRLGWTETASGAIVNRYKASIPSAACGIAAIAMAAITFGLLVVMPATIAPGSGEIRGSRLRQAECFRVIGIGLPGPASLRPVLKNGRPWHRLPRRQLTSRFPLARCKPA